MDYDLKANLTTILSTYLIPLIVGYGFSEASASALVGVVVSLLIIGFNMLNEMYTSKHLTVSDDDDVSKNSTVSDDSRDLIRSDDGDDDIA